MLRTTWKLATTIVRDLGLVALMLCFCLGEARVNAADAAKKKATFEKDILPIFRAKCIRCHAGVEPKGDLNLARPSSLLTGGQSGAAVRIGAAEFSLLYEKVSSNEMPAVGAKLTPAEKGLIRTWINDGADGIPREGTIDSDAGSSELWSFKPPVRPVVPSMQAEDQTRNPIDAFILRRLREAGLQPAQEADHLTLLRRTTFDLIGLPPTPEEIQGFLADDRPGAHERLVDRLLASPRYGERWGRHWLDVAGYADSAGILNEDRRLPLIWRYRDYVLRAFNSDKPYDRFLQEQIAGDELTDYWKAYESLDRLPNDVIEGITATGFLRTAADPSRPDFKTIKNAHAQYYYPTLFDTLQIVASSTMGLTIQCARCHSHKFDPIPQADYYRMQAVFTNAYRPDNWTPQMNRRLLVASKKQKAAGDQQNAKIAANVKRLQTEIAQHKQQHTDRLFELRLKQLPSQIQADVKAAINLAKDKRSVVQKYLAEKFATKLRPAAKELDAALIAQFKEFKPRLDQLNAEIAAENKRRAVFDEIRALYDMPGNFKTPVLLRGDPLTPGATVTPGVIAAIESPKPLRWQQPGKEARSSGRRLAFAEWLTQPGHPLTPRVMVNRIWMHHFGQGIVATPDDFGVSGSPPSHPQLLDWLATEFVRSGWSIKHMHRLILTSSTWKRRSRVNRSERAAGQKHDPENKLLWRQNMRRLEAEPLRDAVLAASSTLSNPIYGFPQAVSRLKSGEVVIPENNDRNRRSVYVMILRLNPETMLRAFDQPEIAVNCTERSISTVATQALTLLNSDAMVRAAKSFADRVRDRNPSDPIAHAVMIAWCRLPDADEHRLMSQFLANQAAKHSASGNKPSKLSPQLVGHAALVDLCHMLLGSNEFAYVD